MLVELSGIDGSGKSTVASAVAGFFADRGVPVVEMVLRSTAKRMLDGIARAQGHADWRGRFDADAVEFAHAIEMSQQVQATLAPLDRTRRVVVIDTYVVRWLATAHLKGARDLGSLAAVYARLPTPDVSLRLRLPPELALQRILARPKGDRVSGPTALDRLTRYAQAFELVRPHVPYVERCLDASQPSSAVVAAVLDALGEAHR